MIEKRIELNGGVYGQNEKDDTFRHIIKGSKCQKMQLKTSFLLINSHLLVSGAGLKMQNSGISNNTSPNRAC